MMAEGINFIMLLSDWFLERLEKRIQAAREEGYAEGYAEGFAESYAAAKAENGDAVEKSPDPPSKSSNSSPKPKKNPK